MHASALSPDNTNSTAVCVSELSSDNDTSTAVNAPALSSDNATSTAVHASALSPDNTNSTAVCVSELSSDNDTSTAVNAPALSSDNATSTAVHASASPDNATSTAVCASALSPDNATSPTHSASALSPYQKIIIASTLPLPICSWDEAAGAGPQADATEVSITVDSQQQLIQTQVEEDFSDTEEKSQELKAQEMSTNCDEVKRTEDEERTSDVSDKSLEVFHDDEDDLLGDHDGSGSKDNYASNPVSNVSLTKDVEHTSGSSPDLQITGRLTTSSPDKAAQSNLSPSEPSSKGYSGLAPSGAVTLSSEHQSDLSSDGHSSQVSRAGAANACNADLPQEKSDYTSVANDIGVRKSSPCSQEQESSAALCGEEVVSKQENVDETKVDATVLSVEKSDDQTFEGEETAEVLPKGGSGIQLEDLCRAQLEGARLQKKETDLFAVEADSDDEPPAPHYGERQPTRTATSDDDNVEW